MIPFRPPINLALLEELLRESDDAEQCPPTEPRPVFAEAWAKAMNTYPERL